MTSGLECIVGMKVGEIVCSGGKGSADLVCLVLQLGSKKKLFPPD